MTVLKLSTLGLPPDLPIDLDDSLIRQFQLVAPEATELQDAIARLQDELGNLAPGAGVNAIEQILGAAYELVAPVRQQLADTQNDIGRMDRAVADRESTMEESERKLFERDRQQLSLGQQELERQAEVAINELQELRNGLSEASADATVNGLVVWLSDLYRLAQGSILVQARGRLEAITVETIELDSHDAYQIALENRLDFMNGRAALVDSWRLIAFNADAIAGKCDRRPGRRVANFAGQRSQF